MEQSSKGKSTQERRLGTVGEAPVVSPSTLPQVAPIDTWAPAFINSMVRTSPASMQHPWCTQGQGSSSTSPLRPCCGEQSWESPFPHHTALPLGSTPSTYSPAGSGSHPQLSVLLLSKFGISFCPHPSITSTAFSRCSPQSARHGTYARGCSLQGERQGRHWGTLDTRYVWEAGGQTSKTLEKQLKSDLPFPKSWKEVQEHWGAPIFLPVPGTVRAAPLCGRGTDPQPFGVPGWGAAPQTAAQVDDQGTSSSWPKVLSPTVVPPH